MRNRSGAGQPARTRRRCKVRREWNEVWWQELPKSRAYVGADHRTGLQQRTVGLDLGRARPHSCVGHGRGIGRTLHGDILNVNGNQQGRWEYPEQRHSPVISLKKPKLVGNTFAFGPYRPVVAGVDAQ